MGMRALLAMAAFVALDAFALEAIPVSASAWFVRGESGLPSLANRGFNSNAGFVVTSEGVVVFDALGTPALGAELLAEIRRRTSQPVRRVIVSHYHADHFYGLAPFKAAGAEIWAHRAAERYLASDEPRTRLAERSRTLAPWVSAGMPFVAPDRWLDGETSFRLGGLSFRVLSMGPAHSPEDLALLVEQEGVLFAGDLLFAGRIPFVGDADSKAWLSAIDRIEKFNVRVVVPGHGDASRNAAPDLELTRDYLVYLRKTMGAAADELVHFEQAYARTDWSRFSHLPAFDAVNRVNAYNTYIRMQGEDK
jgi:glyoxylase-like metal-dependent hydrolase (beta-lactamase superfamily II)